MWDFSLLFTLTKEFACQLCSNNCSEFHQILLLTLNLLVRLMTEYFHVIFSLGTWRDEVAKFGVRLSHTLLGSAYLRVTFNLFYTLLSSVYLRVTFDLFYTLLGSLYPGVTFNLFYTLLSSVYLRVIFNVQPTNLHKNFSGAKRVIQSCQLSPQKKSGNY